MSPSFDAEAVVREVRALVPNVDAIYAFGSFARGDARADSDLDIAILAGPPLSQERRFELAESIASVVHRDVDVVDLRAASTVLRVEVIRDGRVLLDSPKCAAFEAEALSDYARLNEERADILRDVAARRRVHG